MAENNLKNTILVDGVEYNIYAKYSETAGTAERATTAGSADTAKTAETAGAASIATTADKVSNGLTVKESGSQIFVFDGSTGGQVIDYVSAANGGKFNNAVLIDNKYPNIQNVPEQAVINFSQINELVHALKSAPLYKWGSSAQLESYIGSNNALQGLNIVVGTATDLVSFKRFVGVPDTSQSTTQTRYYGMSLAGTSPTSNPPWTGCSVGSYNKNNTAYTEIYIPSIGYITEVNGVLDLTEAVPVTSIRESAFESNKTIETVVIPESITTINSYAFRYCSALKSIKLPSKLERLSVETFNGCTSLESIVIGKNVKKISRDVFKSCSSLKTVYYEGTEDDWLAFNKVDTITYGDDIKQISNTGNNALTDVYTKSKARNSDYNFIFNYKYTADFRDLPCLYICVDNTNYTSNKMFLKLPESGLLIDMTQEANRLVSPSISQNYYTYEGLAEIIARINLRLDALGGETLKIKDTNTALAKILSIDEVDTLVPTVDVKADLDPNSIPTVQSLSEAIDTVRGDLDDLAREVDIELNREDNEHNILPRLIAVEDAIQTLSGTADKLTLKDTYGEVTLSAEELRKIKALINAIDWS